MFIISYFWVSDSNLCGLFIHSVWFWSKTALIWFPSDQMNRIIGQLVENFLTKRKKEEDSEYSPSPPTFFGKHALLGSGLVHSCVTRKILKRQKPHGNSLIKCLCDKNIFKGVLSILLSYTAHFYMTSISSAIAFELAIRFNSIWHFPTLYWQKLSLWGGTLGKKEVSLLLRSGWRQFILWIC